VWNSCDTVLPGCKLVHYTAVPTQPWKPYASVRYQQHPDAHAVLLYEQYRKEAAAWTKPT
jgi:hypothetical protein